MGRTRHPEHVRSAVLRMRRTGKTYDEIREKFDVPKSTISVWCKKDGQPIDRTRQLKHLERARKIAFAAIHRKKLDRLAAADSLARITAEGIDLQNGSIAKSLLAMLYWAEGGKQDCNMKFTNTDPELVLLFVTLLRRAYEIDDSRIHIALQIHSYHDKKEIIGFWSRKLRVPSSQFWKPYLKARGAGKKYRKNFAGICNVHYASSAIQREIIALGHEIHKKLL